MTSIMAAVICHEELTGFLSGLKDAQSGEWVIDQENDGSPEHPIQFPLVIYSLVMTGFEDAVCRLVGSHKGMELTRYNDILRKAKTLVDEMFAVCAEIETWRERRESQEASAQKYRDR